MPCFVQSLVRFKAKKDDDPFLSACMSIVSEYPTMLLLKGSYEKDR